VTIRAFACLFTLPADVRRLVPLLALSLLVLGGLAQPPKPVATITGHYSPNIVIITMDGPIDAITSVSIRRRIAEAEKANPDALVVQIDSPGGELGAVLEMTAALKKTSIGRTVAWVNPQAYSGGAITALACNEIVIASGGTFGDAAPIQIGPTGLRSLPPTERAKILSPLLAEVVGSARRNGHDEKLAQGMVTLGVELWLVQNKTTGERLFVDRAEYQLLFDGEPPTSSPRLVGPPENRQARALRANTPAPSAAPSASPTDLLPASPQITPDTVREASLSLTVPSTRPVLTPADKGNWTFVEYVADGTSLFTFSDRDMLDLRIAAAKVNTTDELKQYLGATNVITITPAWYESAARLLQNYWIRGFLIIVVILGLFIEFVHPGLILPASAAGLALLGLLLPEILMGLAGWWEVVMIIVGIVLIAVEMFLMPGVGVAGAFGLLSLMAGLVLAFIPVATPTFPGMERSSTGLLWGIGFVLIGITSAATVGYYMSKNMRTLPVLGRLVLRDRPRDEDLEGEPDSFAPPPDAPVVKGQEGIAITPLRPSGKADFDGRVVDVVSDGLMVQPGGRVRVVAVEGMRVVVEPA
jgi:membrane-bound serine protease (ClpP class)